MSRNEGMKKGRKGGREEADGPNLADTIIVFYQYSVVTPCRVVCLY